MDVIISSCTMGPQFFYSLFEMTNEDSHLRLFFPPLNRFFGQNFLYQNVLIEIGTVFFTVSAQNLNSPKMNSRFELKCWKYYPSAAVALTILSVDTADG